MNILAADYLKEGAKYLEFLKTSLLAISKGDFKAKDIRNIEKSLVFLDSIFSHEHVQNCQKWLEVYKGCQFLKRRLNEVQALNRKLANSSEKVFGFESRLAFWKHFSSSDKKHLMYLNEKINAILKNGMSKKQTDSLYRLKSFYDLRCLEPYSQNPNYIYTAIYHNKNEVDYEQRLESLNKAKNDAISRAQTVKRGAIISLLFCFFIVTIPICLPFFFSLIKRRNEILKHIANVKEKIRQENYRLNLAQEGALAGEDIQNLFGDIGIEKLKNVMKNYITLKSEFQDLHTVDDIPIMVLKFVLENKRYLETALESFPKDPLDMIFYFNEKINEIRSIISDLKNLNSEIDKTQSDRENLLKGYTESILKNSISDLEFSMSQLVNLEIGWEFKKELASACLSVPEIMNDAKTFFKQIERGCSLEKENLTRLLSRIDIVLNTLSLCDLERKSLKAHSA